MRFPCHPVDASFFDTGPCASRTSWNWRPRQRRCSPSLRTENPGPNGFAPSIKCMDEQQAVWHGTTRTVWLTLATLDEHFFRWEQNRRCSFYVTGHSMPLAHALAEDYLLEEVAPSKTRFTYAWRLSHASRSPWAVPSRECTSDQCSRAPARTCSVTSLKPEPLEKRDDMFLGLLGPRRSSMHSNPPHLCLTRMTSHSDNGTKGG
jgi:hypothetical protein